jgi:serine/threonine protein kinase
MSVAPFSENNKLLGRLCAEWSIEELKTLQSKYGFPDINSGDKLEICKVYSKTLPSDCNKDYTLIKKIASGSGGAVYNVCDVKNNCELASKYVKCVTDKDISIFDNEVHIIKKLSVSQPALSLPLVDSWKCQVPFSQYDYYYKKNVLSESTVGIFVTPLAEVSLRQLDAGEVYNRVIPRFITSKDCMDKLKSILLGLKTIGVMHRDLHTSNIVIYKGELKLIDFGLSWDKTTRDLTSGQPNFMTMETEETIPSEWEPTYDRDCLVYDLKTNLGLSDEDVYPLTEWSFTQTLLS